MKAIRLHDFGPAENLRHVEVDDPVPGPGQVRIAVRAAGVHLLDVAIQKGDAEGLPFPPPQPPFIPGREVAGVVDRLGDGVDRRWLGRRVVTHLGLAHGGYAELAVREVEALHEIPEELNFAQAVAMIGTGRTAIGILDAAQPKPEDVVLVTAAAGGIGGLLVQHCRHLGATVIGLAGGERKTERVRRLGAHVAVDYTRPGWPDEVREELNGREITLAFDGVGGEPGRAALELLGMAGRFVMFGWSAGAPTKITTDDLYARVLTVTVALGPRLLARPGGLRSLETAALAAAAGGRMVPDVQTFALAEAAAAHTALDGRATVGKVVLVP
ncbi:zinc-binding dehydrogenase [Thermomonospora cellulosilytica]|uniref:NADPH2:quinone reductase n=1 Tax=Thermomonospora cellulosilytica TaxID=1411118 RepID=A0A7W3MYJ5_9ACTN|nr:zinc-binding dehydrogenase [Thermomonospora cellulosilytica]MBA9004278.1 NADPH2:quinone reductase [Thermomonospora cellulosilytica]